MRALSRVILCCTVALSFASSAKTDPLQGVTVRDPWVRPAGAASKVTAAYLSLDNRGDTDDTLLSASSPISRTAQIHATSLEDGVMKMRQVDGGVVVPAGGTVTFKPGGYHIMLMDLTSPLEEGQRISLTLRFAKAGQVDVQALVARQGPSGAAGQHSAPPMDGMHTGH